MGRFRCKVCGYIYDPEKGDEKRAISPGIRFEELSDKWRCPVCEYPKSHFYRID
ncbi:rubredoxin [Persephonella sp. IF05-L8]|uniref:rubredoxin n=1 Tax=Persephonella sp. IF05-L8 TaxID=1158338 RepID=UPI000496D38D